SWAKQGEDTIDDPELTLWSYCSATCVYGPTDNDACVAVGQQFLGGVALYAVPQGDNASRCLRVSNNSYLATVERTGQCPAGSNYSPTLRGCVIEGDYIPVTDSDFQELEAYLPSAPASTVGDAAGDIQRKIGGPLPGYTDLQMEGPASVTGPETTTTTTTETGDNIVTNTQTTTNITYGDTTITTTNTTVTNTYTNGNLTSTETTT